MKPNEPEAHLSRRSLLAGLASVLCALPAAQALAKAGQKVVRAIAWDPKFELAVEVEINTQDGFRVHRPYVAVWIENPQGKSVRTLALWVQTARRGPRWIPDLRRWFRDEEDRKKADGGDLIATVSSPTRNAGKYTLVWDGKDDAGKLVTQGAYTVCIEAAREHGTYQLIRKDVEIGKKAFKLALDGNVEIKGATVEYRKRK